MESFNENPREIGIRIGMTKQGVIHMLKVDDCLLSKAHQIAAFHNCKIEFSLTPPYRSIPSDDNITLDLSNISRIDLKKYRGTRTYFLRKALAESGHNMNTIQTALVREGYSIKVCAIRCWFGEKDDLYLSWVYNIAQTLHSEVKIKISSMTAKEMKANPYREVLEENLTKMQQQVYRVGRKPNWLKILEQEYKNNPEGLQRAIDEKHRDDEIRKQIKEEKKTASANRRANDTKQK